MKVLSLWEPWATLMAVGEKVIETRSWHTGYRAWLAIHSAKHFTADEDDLCWQEPFRGSLIRAEIPIQPYRSGRRFQFPHGCILAVVCVHACCPTTSVFRAMPRLDCDKERAFGNYDPGRWAWVTAERFRLPDPIPFKGEQGLRDLPDQIEQQIMEQWKPLEAREQVLRKHGVIR
jgi:hypothetical protein